MLRLLNAASLVAEFSIRPLPGTPERDPVYSFEGTPDRKDSISLHPYGIKNNAWRIKPMHPESTKEIYARVLSYLHFESCILNGGHATGKTTWRCAACLVR